MTSNSRRDRISCGALGRPRRGVYSEHLVMWEGPGGQHKADRRSLRREGSRPFVAGLFRFGCSCVYHRRLGGARGCPGGEELEPVGGRCVGVGGVDVESECRLGGQFHGFEIEVEFADGRVPQSLTAAAVELDVLRSPLLPEQF